MNATNATVTINTSVALTPEQEELRFARDVIDAAEELAHELSRLSPSNYSWPTTATMEGVNGARKKLTDAIYHYDCAMLRLQGQRRAR